MNAVEVQALDTFRQQHPMAMPGAYRPGNEATMDIKPMLCPFGCGIPHCDENGYCDHLIGFTDHRKAPDGSGRELFEQTKRREHDGRYQTGEVKREKNAVGYVEEFGIYRAIRPTDIIVPMNNGKPGKWFAGTSWDRVYRAIKDGESTITRPRSKQMVSRNQEVAELQNIVSAQAKQIEALATERQKDQAEMRETQRMLREFGIKVPTDSESLDS